MVTRIQVPISWDKVETWEVPRGFGQEYLRRARNRISAFVWCDILGLIGIEVTPEMFKRLTLRQIVESELYATREHLSASDNAVQRHPRPEWIDGLLQGNDTGAAGKQGEATAIESVRESSVRRLGRMAGRMDRSGKGENARNIVSEKHVGAKKRLISY